MSRILGLFSLLCLAGGLAAAQEIRIACVHMEKVFDGYYKTHAADAKLDAQRGTYKEYIEEQQKAIAAKEKLFQETRDQAQNIALSPEARKAKEDEFRALEQEIRQQKKMVVDYSRQKLDSLREMREKERGEILKEINVLIGDMAAKEGYTLVLDLSGETFNRIPTVVYYRPEMEITERVLATLNAGHEHELRKPEERAKPATDDLGPVRP